MPEAGVEHLDDATTKSKGENYLFDELTQRIAVGPIRFNTQVQIADDGDIVDDATIHWPGDRPVVPFGTVELTAKAPDDEAHRRIIFDPIPRVDGIEPSDDPLLELRAAVYLLSGRRRRQAAESKARTSRSTRSCPIGEEDMPLFSGRHSSKIDFLPTARGGIFLESS